MHSRRTSPEGRSLRDKVESARLPHDASGACPASCSRSSRSSSCCRPPRSTTRTGCGSARSDTRASSCARSTRRPLVFSITFAIVFLFVYGNFAIARRRTAERPPLVLGSTVDGRPITFEGRQPRGSGAARSPRASRCSRALTGAIELAGLAELLPWRAVRPDGRALRTRHRRSTSSPARLPVRAAAGAGGLAPRRSSDAAAYYVFSGSFVLEARPGGPAWPRVRLMPSARRHLSLLAALVLSLMAWGAWLEHSQHAALAGAAERGAVRRVVHRRLRRHPVPLGDARRAGSRRRPGPLAWLRPPGWPLPLAVALYVMVSLGGGALRELAAAPGRDAERAEQGTPVHHAQHRRDARGLRPRPRRRARAVGRRRADRQRHHRQRRHDRERPALGSPAAAADVRADPGDPHLLRLQRRRQRPLHDRRQVPAGHALGARAEHREHAEPVVGERTADVHARLRRHARPGQRGHDRGAAGAVHPGPAAGIDASTCGSTSRASTTASCRTSYVARQDAGSRSSTTRAATTTRRRSTRHRRRAGRLAAPAAAVRDAFRAAPTSSSRASSPPTAGSCSTGRSATASRLLAPFLALDADPYPVCSGGRLFWMQDAYTTTANYPYATPRRSRGSSASINYIRNSVKIVIDAYNGTVSFYLAEPDDPLVADASPASSRAAPSAVARCPRTCGGTSAIRRTSSGFRRRSTATYHMTNPQVFYNKEDQWEVPAREPGAERRRRCSRTTRSCGCRARRRPSSSRCCRSRRAPRTTWPPGWWRAATASTTASCSSSSSRSRSIVFGPQQIDRPHQPGPGHLAADHALEPAGLRGASGARCS